MKDFIEGNDDIVDKEVPIRFRNGEKQAVTESLNQIHWRSLKMKRDEDKGRKVGFSNVKEELVLKASKSYAEIVKTNGDTRVENDSNGWTLVQRRKFKEKVGLKNDVGTIFMVNIPLAATAKGIWDFFKSCGKIKDIILPRKRDKNGKRIGFIKVVSEIEPGLVISNVKEKGSLTSRIVMSINSSQKKVDINNNLQENNMGDKNGRKIPRTTDQKDDCSKKMFEYIEAEVDEEVETGLF